jgi:hypothetical protein
VAACWILKEPSVRLALSRWLGAGGRDHRTGNRLVCVLGALWKDIYVVLLHVVAVEALDIEEGSVEKLELFSGVVGPLREAC